jgi:hypothetical protein
MFINTAADFTPGTFLWQGTLRGNSGHFWPWRNRGLLATKVEANMPLPTTPFSLLIGLANNLE